MSWHYRLRKRKDCYDIIEYYPEMDTWTEDGVGPVADSREDMLKALTDMLRDVLRYPELDKSEEV
jgi:hypothetical protein